MNRKLLVLSAICAALLIIGLVTKRQPHQTITEQARLVDLFSDGLKADDIQRIEIETIPEEKTSGWEGETPGDAPPQLGPDRDPRLVLEKADDSWRIYSRFGARAKNTAVKGLIKSLSGLKGEFRSDASDLLADYGLDEKTAMGIRIFTTGQDKPAQTLLVGKQAGRNTWFVRLDGSNTVYTVDADLRRQVGASSGNLHLAPDYKVMADLDLLDIPARDVRQVRLKTPFTEYRLEKEEAEKADAASKTDPPGDKKADTWIIAGGKFPFTLKQDGPRKMIDQAVRLKAQDVVGSLDTETRESFGLDAPKMEIALTSPKVTTRLLVGKPMAEETLPGGSYYVSLDHDPLVYSVSRQQIDNLLIRQGQVFDLKMWTLRDEDLSEIHIDPDLTVVRKDEGWTLSDLAPEETPNKDRLETLVRELLELTADGPADRLAVEPGGRTLVLVEKNGNRHSLTVGEKDLTGNNRAAFKSMTDPPVLLEKSRVERLFPKRQELLTSKDSESAAAPPPPVMDLRGGAPN